MVRPSSLEGLPASLTELDRWLNWRFEIREGRPTKVPLQVNGFQAKTTIPGHCTSIERAFDSMLRDIDRGLGFVFFAEDGLIGIDLDNCLQNGDLKAWAKPIVERFADTYTEVSPGGEGLKIFAKGSISAKLCGSGMKRQLEDGEVEIYQHSRYFTVTGKRFRGSPAEIEEHTASALWLISRLENSRAKRGSSSELLSAPVAVAPNLSDFQSNQVAALRQNIPQFDQLWRGDNSQFSGDESRGDLSFCSTLARKLRFDAAAIDAAFRCSARMRPKWDTRHFSNGLTYGQATVRKAISTSIVPNENQPAAPSSSAGLIRTRTGEIKPILANAMVLLAESPESKDALAFDEFSQKVVVIGKTPWDRRPGPWTDQDDRLLTEWLQRQGAYVSVELAGQAAQAIARKNPIHPVRNYLRETHWDGVERIDTWVSTYLGARDTLLNRAFGSRWLISAIARIEDPGCKADCILILEGPQGGRKSSALRCLGGPFYSDEISDFGTKDAAMQTQGVWIIEVAELAAMLGRYTEIERVKSFVSRATDRFRPPYGAHVVESKRQCVFAGTVNGDQYLRDETGARRFWPVSVGSIDLESLERDRDQLWAEAFVRYHRGASWWLDSGDLNSAAAEEQANRFEGDPWLNPIESWTLAPPMTEAHSLDGRLELWRRGSFSIPELLQFCIQRPRSVQTKSDEMRVARVLRVLGFQRIKMRVDSITEWRWQRP